MVILKVTLLNALNVVSRNIESITKLSGYDTLIIDTAGYENQDVIEVLSKFADLIIIPMSASKIDLEPSLGLLKKYLSDANAWVLFNNIDHHLKDDVKAMQGQLEAGGIKVFKTLIRRYKTYVVSAKKNLPINQLSPVGAAAAQNDFKALVREVGEING